MINSNACFAYFNKIRGISSPYYGYGYGSYYGYGYGYSPTAMPHTGMATAPTPTCRGTKDTVIALSERKSFGL